MVVLEENKAGRWDMGYCGKSLEMADSVDRDK